MLLTGPMKIEKKPLDLDHRWLWWEQCLPDSDSKALTEVS